MTVSLSDVYQRAGFKLEIIRATENLSAEDGDLIAKTYAGLHDQLLTDGTMAWGPTDEVPEWAVPIIVEMLAAMLVDDFGVEEPRRTTLRAEGIIGNSPVSPAERRLRRQLARTYVSNTVQVEQF